MNELQRGLMGRPDVKAVDGCCPFCGRPATNRHHVVPRSQGGARGPVAEVCGFGNASGCHGLLHSRRLHLDWRGGWVFLVTPGPTKDQIAMEMDGWEPVPGQEET